MNFFKRTKQLHLFGRSYCPLEKKAVKIDIINISWLLLALLNCLQYLNTFVETNTSSKPKHTQSEQIHNIVSQYNFNNYFRFLCYHKQRLILNNDIEVNPGPKFDSSRNFIICHWNLNSIAAYNFSKINLLKVYVTIHKTDIVCLSVL